MHVCVRMIEHDAGGTPIKSSHRFSSLGHIQSSLIQWQSFQWVQLPLSQPRPAAWQTAGTGHAALSPVWLTAQLDVYVT